MKKHSKKILTSLAILSSMTIFAVVGNANESTYGQLMADANLGNIESAKGVQEFAYLKSKQEIIPFLELEMKQKEEDKKREEERLKKIEQAKLKKIEEEKKRLKEEAKAKAEAERLAKEEAARKAKEAAAQKAKEEAEKAARELAEEEARAAAIQKERERQQSLKNTTAKQAPVAKTTQQVGTQQKPAVQVQNSDLDALAKIIYAEANGEPYQGKVAVGAVILNRVADGRFPSSIQGVITAPGQFQPVSNGAYQNARPSSADYNAAKEALSGADPTGGATFFYAPSIATTKWHETLTPTVTIGGHRFFKN